MVRLRSKKEKFVKEKKEPIIHFKPKAKRNYYIPIILIGIFFIVLMLNSYFNHISGVALNPEGTTLGTRYFFSGPDPYYNLRLCQMTMETGQYPFVALSDGDPFLNYPVGIYAGARPPLFNLIAVGSANLLSNFMPPIDALGLSMLFLPAIYGALLVFPVYGIGKELFSKKVGLLAALFVPLIPIHLSSGHGSAYSLFDHDSFLLLMFAMTFFLLIKCLKEDNKTKFILYSILTAIPIACVELTWVASQTLYIMIVIYLLVQMVFDIFKGIKSIKTPLCVTIAFGLAYLITLPYSLAISVPFSFLFFLTIISAGIVILYLIFKKINLWIISIPVVVSMFAGGLLFLYLVNQGLIKTVGAIETASIALFGSGIYGTQVSLTIGEAHTYAISQTALSFGPALYWIGLAGFVFFLYHTFKGKFKSYNLFFAVIFFIQFWFSTVAGRFLNDLIPAICIFSGFILIVLIDKINYKEMIRNIRSVGGLVGIKKCVKLSHIFGVLFIVFIVFLPNSFLAMDAAVPSHMKEEWFGEGYTGIYGLSYGQEHYWSDACYWLSLQDINQTKPGVITWWDYGFYLASMSEHPTVADNYQEGLECAGNFHTAQSEEEATAILIIRLIEGTKVPKKQLVGVIPQEIKDTFQSYNLSENLSNIIENPIKYAPSYNQLIAPEWGNTYLRVDELNSMYHDATDILLTLSDFELTKLYHDVMEITGFSIRYYGVEQRDMYSIFGVFPFLSDKSTQGFVTAEDDWYGTLFVDKSTGKTYTSEEFANISDIDKSKIDWTTSVERKEPFFNSMAYATYFGIKTGSDSLPENRVPAYFLRHWKAEYISPYVSIAKYYEGAKITGTSKLEGMGYDGSVVYVLDENSIPHDYSIVTYGQFNLIAPAGNISLVLFVEDQKLGEYNIGEITEDQAMWKAESNFSADFNVNFSSINVEVKNLNQTATLNITSVLYPTSKKSLSVFNGNYTFDSLVPSTHVFELVNETGAIIYTKNVFLNPNNNNVTLGE